MEVSGLVLARARAVDTSSKFLMIDIINYNIIRGSQYLNDLEYSLGKVCYIFHKNNINKNEKHLKNEQRNRDAAGKKRANTSGVGKVIITITTPIHSNNTHR